MALLINLGIPITLLALGYFIGRHTEQKHYRSIRAREFMFRNLVVSCDRWPPEEYRDHHAGLVSGNVVISIDYFKRFVAGLRTLVGGRMRSYESLVDRARREALLRMQAEAQAAGAVAVINTKFETSRISANAQQGIGSVEVLVYGTALIPRPR